MQESNGSEEPVEALGRPQRKLRHNTRLRSPGLAALTSSAISRVCNELQEFVEKVDAISPLYHRCRLISVRGFVKRCLWLLLTFVVQLAVYLITSHVLCLRASIFISSLIALSSLSEDLHLFTTPYREM